VSGNLQDASPKAHGVDDRAGAVSGSIEPNSDLLSTGAKIIESVPDELRPEARKLVTLATGFSGPTPPPAVLEEYERLVPGSASRFLEDYFHQRTAEAEHRRSLQVKQLEYSHEERVSWLTTVNETRKRGQRFALVVALVVASAGTIALLQGQATAAAVIIGSGIASSIAAMLLGQFRNKQKAPETPDQPAG
jgi:uncharacterized membrane protein